MQEVVNVRLLAIWGAVMFACALVFMSMSAVAPREAQAVCLTHYQVEDFNSSYTGAIYPVAQDAGTANSGTGSMKYSYLAYYADYASKVVNLPCSVQNMYMMTKVDPNAADPSEEIIVGVDFDNDDPAGQSDCSFRYAANASQNEPDKNGFHKYAVQPQGTCTFPIRKGTHQIYIRDEGSYTATFQDFLQMVVQ